MPQTEHWDQPLFCIGLTRSGTSMAMGILSTCGLWIGNMRAPSQYNPKGFFENLRLERRIAEVSLGLVGADPDGVDPVPKIGAFKNLPNIRYMVEFELRADGYQGGRPWGFKSTKMTLSWPIWARAFPNARWVTFRRPDDQVIKSCLRTPFQREHADDPAFSKSRIAVYLDWIDGLKRSGLPWVEVWLRELLAKNRTQLKQIAERLGLSWDHDRVRNSIELETWGGPHVASGK
ncbi:MAG: sulfotransferase [Pseudomonadota bacterium]